MISSRKWQVSVGAGGALIAAAGSFLSFPFAVILSAVGSAILGAAAALFLVRRRVASADAKRAESLEATANSLLEAVLDLYSLYEVGGAVSASLHLDQLLTATMRRVTQATGIESCTLFLVDEDQGALVARSVNGADAESLQGITLQPGEGLAGLVCGTRKSEVRSGESPLPWSDVPRVARSVLAIPLTGRDRVLGALLLYSVHASAFAKPEQLAYFNAVGKQLSVGLDNAILHARATELSYQDTVTGLLNRRYLEEALQTELRRAARYKLSLSLAMIDIDHFKGYNDTYGHARGDEMLSLVGKRLRAQTRNADIVTRYGGEEFAVILPMTSKAHARLVAEKLRTGMSGASGAAAPPDTGLTISVGVATYPEDATTPTELLQGADSALYAAKARGRNRVEVFEKPDAEGTSA